MRKGGGEGATAPPSTLALSVASHFHNSILPPQREAFGDHKTSHCGFQRPADVHWPFAPFGGPRIESAGDCNMGRALMTLLLTGCLAALAPAADIKQEPSTTDATEVSAATISGGEHLPSTKNNWISGKDDESKISFSKIVRDLPPEVAVKKATRLLEEEMERRKKFRSMMRSLVQSDLPHLDPKVEFIEEEVKETPSKVVQKVEEEDSRFQLPFAHILPFMFPFLPPPFSSSLSRSSSGREESPESENSRMVFVESIPPPPEEKSSNKKLETSPKNPMTFLMPRRTLQVDMTFIPIRSESSKQKSILTDGFSYNEGVVKALEVSPASPNSPAVRIFSSGASPNHDSPFTPLDSLPFLRLLNFFRDAEKEVEESAKIEKPVTTTRSTRHKREATTTLSPLDAEPLDTTEQSGPVLEASRSVGPTRQEGAGDVPGGTQEEEIPAPRAIESERAQEQRKTSDFTSRDVVGPLSYRVDPSFFHPHPMTPFLYPQMDPYFHFLPYFINPDPMFPNKLPLSAMLGMSPALAGSPMEQQMVAMNQLSHETASVDAVNGPCVDTPCAPSTLNTAKDNRQRRSIAYGTPFANNALFQRRIPGLPFNAVEPGPSRKSASETEPQEYLTERRSHLGAEENTSEANSSVVESKLSLTGEPEAVRELNSRYKMPFESEKSLKRAPDASEPPFALRGGEKLKSTPYSWKKSFLFPEKKLTKKKLAGVGTMPSYENEDFEGNPPPHPWRAPAFGMYPFSGRVLPSLLSESEAPVDEGMPYRGKRSLSHVRFLHPYIDTEDQGHLKAIQDDLLSGEGAGDAYLSAVAGSKRRKSHGGKTVTILVKGKNKGGKPIEQYIKVPIFGKQKINFTPWLDPTMISDTHDGHIHRQDFSNDVKFSSYDH